MTGEMVRAGGTSRKGNEERCERLVVMVGGAGYEAAAGCEEWMRRRLFGLSQDAKLLVIVDGADAGCKVQ